MMLMNLRTLYCALLALALLALPLPPARAQGYVYAYSVNSTASTSVPTTTETVVCTLNGVSTRFAGLTVRLIGTIQLTTGTGSTNITPRIRRGTTTSGTLVGASPLVSVVAGNNVAVPITMEDSPGEIAGQSYVLTVQQTAATGNGTMGFCELMALVF